MPAVTIAVTACEIEPHHFFVAAALTTDAGGTQRRMGIDHEWLGPPREALALIADEALRLLKSACAVTLVMREPDPDEQPASAEARGKLREAAAGHTVGYVLVPAGEPHEELEAVERFARSTVAGRVIRPTGESPRPRVPKGPEPRLF